MSSVITTQSTIMNPIPASPYTQLRLVQVILDHECMNMQLVAALIEAWAAASSAPTK